MVGTDAPRNAFSTTLRTAAETALLLYSRRSRPRNRATGVVTDTRETRPSSFVPVRPFRRPLIWLPVHFSWLTYPSEEVDPSSAHATATWMRLWPCTTSAT